MTEHESTKGMNLYQAIKEARWSLSMAQGRIERLRTEHVSPAHLVERYEHAARAARKVADAEAAMREFLQEVS